MTPIYKTCQICGEQYKTHSAMWRAGRQKDICINCRPVKDLRRTAALRRERKKIGGV